MKKIIACKSGCAFCCYNMGVTVYEFEKKTVEAIAGVINDIEYEEMPPRGGGVLSACPLLDQSSKTCRIYNDRPMECKGYYSNSVKACKDNLNQFVATGKESFDFIVRDSSIVEDLVMTGKVITSRSIRIRDLVKQLKSSI